MRFIFLIIFNLTVAGTSAQGKWWDSASIYQIYPRSFKDSNGDGIGDINGITQMLPYLKEIGVTATWLSPIFKSPMADFGYDISDFYDIQPEYGTLQDFDNLMKEAKILGLRILLDLVPNHSSDENEWFKKSIRKEAGYEDFYMWHPGFPDPKNSTNRLPPTNWVSVFRYSAWQWNEDRKEFYFHQFLSKQPDLNYRNPAVVQEMKNVITFWLKRGVDGFRIDALPHLFEIAPDKSGNYPNEPLTGKTDDPNSYDYLEHIYTTNQPETIDMVYQWRELLDQYSKDNNQEAKIMLTEAYAPQSILMQYYGNATNEGSIPFNFLLITDLKRDSTATDFARVINSWMEAMPKNETANWVLGNHDQKRVASRFGEEKIDLLNMLIMTLPGIVVTYYGEEIGMTNVWISWNDTVDPQACNTNPSTYENYSRDFERTPFQWDDSLNAGFSNAPHTWLPVASDYRQINAKNERRVIRSYLNTYRRAKDLRATKTLQEGSFTATDFNENVLGITRSLSGESTYIMVANVGPKLERVNIQSKTNYTGPLKVVVSSFQSPKVIGEIIQSDELILLPNEALILQTG